MQNVVFVVPFALETSQRFVRATAGLPGLRLAIIAQGDSFRFASLLGDALSLQFNVDDALNADQLTEAVKQIERRWGAKADRLVGVLEQLQVPLAVTRERLGIPGMGVSAARNFRDKARMKDVLRAHDLPCARHALATSSKDALAFGEEAGYPLVVKPPAGAGAKNTFRVDNREQLAGYLKSQPIDSSGPMLLEEFIIGEEHSFDSASVEGRHVFHSISRYYPTPLEVMETPWIQWCVLLPRDISGPQYADIHLAGRAALDALGMQTGLTHMEWFRRPNGSIAISEVAARPPGAQFTTLLSYAHDLDFYRAWARLVAFGEFEPPARPYAAGAAFLRGQGSGVVRAVHGVESLRAELGELIVESKLPRAGQPPSSSYEGEGFIILRHPDTEVVREGLTRVVSSLRVELG
jgi:biotin carboxylase